MSLKQIRDLVGDVYALYPYGSRVYGTYNSKSDFDYIVIQKRAPYREESFGNIDISIMNPVHFHKLLREHDIQALECLFLYNEPPKRRPYEDLGTVDFAPYLDCRTDDIGEILDRRILFPTRPWRFKLDRTKLRASISGASSLAWVKAKKKFINPYDWAIEEQHRGKKSLFHSLRILMFGIQIAQDGCISNYSEANYFYQEIMANPSKDWADYNRQYKSEYNRLATEFRKLAPRSKDE